MAEPDNDDLFAGSTMTFGEHLEELRRCLFRALICLFLGTLAGLGVSKWVVQVINGPLQRSLEGYYELEAVTRYTDFAAQRDAEGLPKPYSIENVKELIEQQHLIYTMYFVHASAVRVQLEIDESQEPGNQTNKDSAANVTQDGAKKEKAKNLTADDLVPLFYWRKMDEDERMSIKALNPTEAFMVWLKASIVTGFVFASPLIFYFIWSFVAAGLYPHERQYVHIFLPFSVILFLTGALFCFFAVFPIVLEFLFTFNADLGIVPDPRISEWLSFALFLPLGFGLSFQLPLVMLFMERIGMFGVTSYLAKWRIAVLVICVISMLLTPADPLSMVAMALPLVVLYFLGIGLCRYFPKRKGILEE
ncbi:MAG: twin-arginine translocase subunit TatC [Planctomycetales bacterium]